MHLAVIEDTGCSRIFHRLEDVNSNIIDKLKTDLEGANTTVMKFSHFDCRFTAVNIHREDDTVFSMQQTVRRFSVHDICISTLSATLPRMV